MVSRNSYVHLDAKYVMVSEAIEGYLIWYPQGEDGFRPLACADSMEVYKRLGNFFGEFPEPQEEPMHDSKEGHR